MNNPAHAPALDLPVAQRQWPQDTRVVAAFMNTTVTIVFGTPYSASEVNVAQGNLRRDIEVMLHVLFWGYLKDRELASDLMVRAAENHGKELSFDYFDMQWFLELGDNSWMGDFLRKSIPGAMAVFIQPGAPIDYRWNALTGIPDKARGFYVLALSDAQKRLLSRDIEVAVAQRRVENGVYLVSNVVSHASLPNLFVELDREAVIGPLEELEYFGEFLSITLHQLGYGFSNVTRNFFRENGIRVGDMVIKQFKVLSSPPE